MSRATKIVAGVSIALVLGWSGAAMALPKNGTPNTILQNLRKKNGPTNLSSTECANLGGSVVADTTCKFNGKSCHTTTPCGNGCWQQNDSCITQ